MPISTAKLIYDVAKRLSERNHPKADAMFRVAQNIQDGNFSFDPSQENSNYNMEVVDGSGAGSQQTGPAQSNLHPGIESFVNPMTHGEHGMVDDRKIHTCTVTFKAPPSVSEAEMMNYILGIGKNLKVDVDSFKWDKKDAKQSQQAAH